MNVHIRLTRAEANAIDAIAGRNLSTRTQFMRDAIVTAAAECGERLATARRAS